MRGYGFLLMRGGGCGIKSFVSKFHHENPCSLIGKKPPSFVLFAINECFYKWLVGEFYSCNKESMVGVQVSNGTIRV